MKSVYDFEPIDLSPLMVPGQGIAVSCDTEEEAQHLLAALKIQHPTCCISWNFPDVHWGCYKEMGYSPYLNTEYPSLTYCSVGHYRTNGFQILPFKQLLHGASQECADISEDAFLDLLF